MGSLIKRKKKDLGIWKDDNLTICIRHVLVYFLQTTSELDREACR
jgi:hypothetical protein